MEPGAAIQDILSIIKSRGPVKLEDSGLTDVEINENLKRVDSVWNGVGVSAKDSWDIDTIYAFNVMEVAKILAENNTTENVPQAGLTYTKDRVIKSMKITNYLKESGLLNRYNVVPRNATLPSGSSYSGLGPVIFMIVLMIIAIGVDIFIASANIKDAASRDRAVKALVNLQVQKEIQGLKNSTRKSAKNSTRKTVSPGRRKSLRSLRGRKSLRR